LDNRAGYLPIQLKTAVTYAPRVTRISLVVASQLAKREYETRRDGYGADALAWAALKAGMIDEARQAAKDALRLGTQDAKLSYHAGMVARAAGEGGRSGIFVASAETQPALRSATVPGCQTGVGRVVSMAFKKRISATNEHE
jgi:hypothetical protein